MFALQKLGIVPTEHLSLPHHETLRDLDIDLAPTVHAGANLRDKLAQLSRTWNRLKSCFQPIPQRISQMRVIELL